jgi:hypothetical protein
MALRKRPAHLPEIIYSKIQKDVAPETILNGLLAACDAVADSSEIEGVVDGYCHGKELCGPIVTLEANERLGHVRPEKRTVNRIASALAMDPVEVGHIIEGLAGEGTQIETDLAANWFESEIVNGPGNRITISKRPAWLFRTENHISDPFAGDIPCLPWSLGLPLWAKTTTRTAPPTGVACLGYRLAAKSLKDARIPTMIDAGFGAAYYHWEPGGRTAPHRHGPASCTQMLEEVVVDPPPLASIERPIVRFKSKNV